MTEWPMVPLRQLVVDMQPGFACQPTDRDDGYPQLRTNNVSSEGQIDLALVKSVPAKKSQVAKYSLLPGDVLFNNTNSPALVGKTALFDDEHPYLFSNHMTRVRVDRGLIEPGYLARFLHKEWRAGAFRGLVTQWVSQAAINRAQLGSVPVPLPPLSEQRRIVEILDQADHLRRLRTEANTKATRILPALFLKMFGDPATNPMGWRTRPMGELATLGPQYGANARAAELSPGAPRYVRITDVEEGGNLRSAGQMGIADGDYEQYRLEVGDVLFARSGATVGKTYIYRAEDGPCVFAGYLIRFRFDPSEIHPEVLFAFTQTSAYQAWVGSKRRAAAQPNINGQEYSSLTVPVPDLPAQDAFVEASRRFRVVRLKSATAERGADALYSILLGYAFSGDLTQRWRTTRMKELLAETRSQAEVLRSAD